MPSLSEERNSHEMLPDNPQIRDYFIRLNAQCAKMPDAVLEDRRQELQFHLASLIDAQRADGVSEDDAVSAALVQMGDAAQIGRTLMRQWRASHGLATRAAFYITIAANLFALAWLFESLLLRDMPNPGIILLASIAPTVAGILCGFLFPQRATRSMLLAVPIIIAASVAMLVGVNSILYGPSLRESLYNLT